MKKKRSRGKRKGVRLTTPKVRKERELTAKQLAFAQEYAVDGNATQAAKRAGYGAKSAHVQGCELLKHPKVAAIIADLTAERAKKAEVTAERLDEEAGFLALSDIRKLFDDDGNPIAAHQLPEAMARAVAGIKIVEKRLHTMADGPILILERTYEYKFWDKNVAIVTLHRRHGRLTDKTTGSIAVSGELGLKARVMAEYARFSTDGIRELEALETQREVIIRRELGIGEPIAHAVPESDHSRG